MRCEALGAASPSPEDERSGARFDTARAGAAYLTELDIGSHSRQLDAWVAPHPHAAVRRDPAFLVLGLYSIGPRRVKLTRRQPRRRRSTYSNRWACLSLSSAIISNSRLWRPSAMPRSCAASSRSALAP